MKEKSRRRPGWLALTGFSVVAALAGAGLGAGGVYAMYGQSRPVAISQDGSASAAPVISTSADAPDWNAVHDAVGSTVVAITASSLGQEAAGSGVIIDADGHIITNNHVISGAENLQVSLADGRVFDATLVGTDAATDLAVIKLVDPPADLTFATLGTSSDLAVGQPVAAIGNPLGLDSTMTTGIISALNRPVTTQGDLTQDSTPVVTNAIQVDAAVNPGNSGGPLFDAQGRVIGINSSIATLGSQGQGNAGSIGLGFAIPMDQVRMVTTQLIDDGVAEHAFLGVTIRSGLAQYNGQSRVGAYIDSVSDGTPAAAAGLRAGDVITAVNGNDVSGGTSLTGFVRQYQAGDVVTVTYVRSGQMREVDVTLTARQD